ncbi:Chaperone protein DnaK [Posidoniimonas corsicana]|uniref:Chaperone protein DnaK n=1 Tax=Posidoniimonas corsicana TaxID=1938618 RepID=A0A5C5VEG1_9BACT|nr:Hsp70 family protein [Posidoniimonas corsicana]TWT37008.1 Chaperone protein DnaK [Posidoniimonas corsicana]
MSLRIPVGIDLGTTFCAAARINEAGRTEIVESRPGKKLLPSLVHFAPDEVTVGLPAGESDSHPRTTTIANAKRRLAGSNRLCEVNGKPMPAEVVLGYLLKDIKNTLSNQLGPAFSSVITVPAYFDEVRRQAIKNAGEMSGLEVVDIVNEPTAAVLAFGEHLGYLDKTGVPCQSLNVLVYDLGGGTFDVTAIQLRNQEIKTLATDGDTELGGLNWDECLAELLQHRYEEALAANQTTLANNERYWLEMANRFKHALSSSPTATDVCDGSAGPQEITVTRNDFAEATAHLTDRTLFTTRQCLNAAGWAWGDIDRLILVGGSTRMPCIRESLRQESRLDPESCIDPDEAVARGAAIYAQSRLSQQGVSTVARELTITNVASHSLGIVGVDIDTLHREVIHLIPKNNPLPTDVERDFVTRVEGQKSVEVQVTEGESSSPEHNQIIGKARIVNLPPGLPAGAKVRIKYSYDANGCLSVDAVVPGAGLPAKLDLKREKTLNSNQLSRWSEVVNQPGGFNDFSDAILSIMDEPELESAAAADTNRAYTPAKPSKQRDRSLEPAHPEGAPKAASSKLKQSAKESADRVASGAGATSTVPKARLVSKGTRGRRSNPFASLLVNGTMSVLSAVVGLLLGYYVLCVVRPEANVLNLRLPGVDSPAHEVSPPNGP